MSNSIEKRQNGAMTATDGFAEQSITTTGSTVEAIMAAREKALVEARMIVAMRRPRNWDVVRDKLKKAVERPGFADADIERQATKTQPAKRKQKGSAWYELPGYDGAEGFTIRFAEECIRAMGNLDIQSQVMWDDDQKRIINVTVMDLESNVAIPKQIIIERTMERRFLKKGQVALGTRVTSSGKINYIIPADDAEMTKKQNSAESKAIRNAVLRLIPGDIQSECRQRIMEIRHGDTAKDPDGARRKILDAFSAINVSPDDLEEYVGFDLDKLSPPQIDHLRGLHGAIKRGETTWKTVIDEVRDEREDDDGNQRSEKPTLDTVAQDNVENVAASKLETIRSEILTKASSLYGDNGIQEILKICRSQPNGGFSFQSASDKQLNLIDTELDDRISAIEAEKVRA